MNSCVSQHLASVCEFGGWMASKLPCPEESAHVKTLFWSSVVGSWALSFVRQNGQRNFSIVDRLWPLFPVVLVAQWLYDDRAYFSCAAAADDLQVRTAQHKAIAAMVLVAIWGARLCFNSIRRGDYAVGAEDYRWAVTRAAIERRLPACSCLRWAVWETFNIVFISLFQLALLYLISVPLRLAIQYTATVADGTVNAAADGWSFTEIALVVLMIVLLEVEAIADQQMYKFQQRKKQGALTKHEAEAGFVHSGLWKYSRHPNVACEQAFWVVMCVFCATATGTDLGSPENIWLLSGPALLILLMWASVQLTESISRSKYPLYQAYQLQTSRLIPWKPWSAAQVINHAHSKL
ncbi:hypothetical protein LPJ63_003451 [Coemansia sp. RSA 2711]|nr:hypothetical protein LPJ63_003451 [Coemansia sp. RSA 2711]